MATSHPHTTTTTTADGRSTFLRRLSDAEILDHAADLVDEFLVFLRREIIGHDILDEAMLPANKSTLENAFRLAIATETRPTFRHQLVKAGLMLARFQSGIGERLSIIPVPADPGSARESAKHADTIDGRHQNRLAKLDAAFARADHDTRRLAALFEASIRIALRREAHAPSPFRSDGTYTWHGHS